MKAIQIQSHGDLEVLRVKTLPDPDPDVDELLVRIKASAVNPLDGTFGWVSSRLQRNPR